MLINTQANMIFPASVSVFMKAIENTINLSGFNRQTVLNFIGLSHIHISDNSFV